jgi:hypothetical protein
MRLLPFILDHVLHDALDNMERTIAPDKIDARLAELCDRCCVTIAANLLICLAHHGAPGPIFAACASVYGADWRPRDVAIAAQQLVGIGRSLNPVVIDPATMAAFGPCGPSHIRSMLRGAHAARCLERNPSFVPPAFTFSQTTAGKATP